MTNSSNTNLPPCAAHHWQLQFRLELLAGTRPELHSDAAGGRGLQHTSAWLDGNLINSDEEVNTQSHLPKLFNNDYCQYLRVLDVLALHQSPGSFQLGDVGEEQRGPFPRSQLHKAKVHTGNVEGHCGALHKNRMIKSWLIRPWTCRHELMILTFSYLEGDLYSHGDRVRMALYAANQVGHKSLGFCSTHKNVDVKALVFL